MANVKLPFTFTYIDKRNGKEVERYKFRRRGFKTHIRGQPGSPEFMEHYAKLVRESENPVARIGARRTKGGTVDALVVRYLGSDAFKALAPATQALRRRILDSFRACTTPEGGFRYGSNNPRTMREKNIRDAIAGRPPTVQTDWLKALRPWNAFGIEQGEMRDITSGVKPMRPAPSDGFLAWGDEQIVQYREHYPNGTKARVALELTLNTAGRRGDVHLLGRQHSRDGSLTWRPSKTSRSTGKLLTVPVLPELQIALDAMPPSDALAFVLNEHGRPFASAASFGNAFADWCTAAGLKPVKCDDGKVRSYRLHGLRKAACTRLAEAGCSAMEIMSVSGHVTLSEAQKYVDAVDQKRMAAKAMAKLSGSVAPVTAIGSNPVQTGAPTNASGAPTA